MEKEKRGPSQSVPCSRRALCCCCYCCWQRTATMNVKGIRTKHTANCVGTYVDSWKNNNCRETWSGLLVDLIIMMLSPFQSGSWQSIIHLSFLLLFSPPASLEPVRPTDRQLSIQSPCWSLRRGSGDLLLLVSIINFIGFFSFWFLIFWGAMRRTIDSLDLTWDANDGIGVLLTPQSSSSSAIDSWLAAAAFSHCHSFHHYSARMDGWWCSEQVIVWCKLQQTRS